MPTTNVPDEIKASRATTGNHGNTRKNGWASSTTARFRTGTMYRDKLI
jgi:hypothetical protein